MTHFKIEDYEKQKELVWKMHQEWRAKLYDATEFNGKLLMEQMKLRKMEQGIKAGLTFA